MLLALTKGYFATIDDEDYERVSNHSWCIDEHKNTLYATTRFKRKKIYLHRFLTNPGPGQVVDHKDGNGLNCSKSNLRLCSQSENLYNKKKKSGTSSKWKGVYWYKRNGKWKAQITRDGRITHLGYFDNEADAATVYNFYAFLYYGEFAVFNLPLELV